MSLFASIGSRLLRYDLGAAGALHACGEIELGSPVHYAWPHPYRRLLYVACSERMIAPRDSGHQLVVVGVPDDGAPLRQVGPPVPLRSRTIHMTLDRTGSYVFCLFNDPPGLQVHAIDAGGAIGPEIPQRRLELGVYPHQVRVFPDNRWLVVAARGYNPRGGKPEEPGALYRFAIDAGRLTPVQKVAPNAGFGFGPRHLDFHPWLPCLYVSLERQNQLQVFRHVDGSIEERPWQVLDTLAPGKRPEFEQFAGAVHVDPAGAFAYVANRDDPHPGKEASHLSGDNSMAVFRLDPATGAASLAGHSELDAYHVRTFSLRPPYLVAASQVEVALPSLRVPASLGVFRMGGNGLLAPVHRTEVATGGTWLFWCGFPRAYGSRWD